MRYLITQQEKKESSKNCILINKRRMFYQKCSIFYPKESFPAKEPCSLPKQLGILTEYRALSIFYFVVVLLADRPCDAIKKTWLFLKIAPYSSTRAQKKMKSLSAVEIAPYSSMDA